MIVQIAPTNTSHFVVIHVDQDRMSGELATIRPDPGTDMGRIDVSIANCAKWVRIVEACRALTNSEPRPVQQYYAVCQALIERQTRLLYGWKHDLILKLITTIERFHHFKRCFITGIQ